MPPPNSQTRDETPSPGAVDTREFGSVREPNDVENNATDSWSWREGHIVPGTLKIDGPAEEYFFKFQPEKPVEGDLLPPTVDIKGEIVAVAVDQSRHRFFDYARVRITYHGASSVLAAISPLSPPLEEGGDAGVHL